MKDKIKKFLGNIIDSVFPRRSNFDIVKKISEKDLLNLPKAGKVQNFGWIYSLFNYKNDSVKAIIWELKYKDNTAVLEYIGKILYDEIMALVSDIILFDQKAEFLLIPIPISNKRRSERGYNQSEYISRSIMENNNAHILLYSPQWFQKTKDTISQSHSQSKEERMKNLTGCFEANPNVEGKYVILIDDVATTGSTLSEARKTLLEVGAKYVYAFTIAH
jgi:ComF family protein